VSNEAKKLDDEVSVKPEADTQSGLTNERELRLANNFDDPELEAIVPVLGLEEAPDPVALVHETADAVAELVTEAAAQPPVEEDAADALSILGMGSEPSNPQFAMEPNEFEGVGLSARWKMAEQLFQLVACDEPFSALVEKALATIVEGMGAVAGSILELDFNKDEFFFRASLGGGDPEQLHAFRVPKDKGIVGHVAESRQFILLRDLADDQKQLRAISMSTGFEAQTCIAGPILVANQLYGVVEIFNKRTPEGFTEIDVRLLEQMVKMLTKVLEVRFLTAELARRVR
jgi:hypothetical protein